MKSEQNPALSRRAFIGATATIGAATALTATNPFEAYAVTAAEKKAQANEALSKLKNMQSKLSDASTDYVNAEAEQLAAKAKMDEAQQRIDEATGQIEDLQDQLGTRARSMYRSGSTSFLDLLLGATSFTAFTNNWGILNNMNESDAEMVEQTKTLRTEVQEQKEVYTQQEAVAAENVEKAAAAQKEAQALYDEMQVTYNTLSAEAQELYNQEAAAAAAAAEERDSTVSNNNDGRNNNRGNTINSSGGSTSKGQSYSGAAALARGMTQKGKPYQWGGSGNPGWDCSHLVCYALGISYRTSGWFASLPNASDPQIGDPVYSPGHVALYAGNGMMLEAQTDGVPVGIYPLRGTVKRM